MLPKRNDEGTSFMGLRVRDETREKLKQVARREEVSLSQVFRWAIREYLEKRCPQAELPDGKEGSGDG